MGTLVGWQHNLLGVISKSGAICSLSVKKMRKNADKLDGMMALMFEFIAETCGQRRSVPFAAGAATAAAVTAAASDAAGGSAAGEPEAELPDGTGDAERLLHALLVAVRILAERAEHLEGFRRRVQDGAHELL